VSSGPYELGITRSARRAISELLAQDAAAAAVRRLEPAGRFDWLSQLYRESRARVDAAAVAAGRDPAEIVSVYNFGGPITPEPLAATRGEDGRWIGGSARQWADELTTAVMDHHAAGFIYRNTDDTPANQALARWATEILPAVREAITR
jgi:hypothetical protein